jgi:hypothetical protein
MEQSVIKLILRKTQAGWTFELTLDFKALLKFW